MQYGQKEAQKNNASRRTRAGHQPPLATARAATARAGASGTAPPPTTPAAPPTTAPLQSPVEATSSVKRLAKARAGLMSPEERQELYGLVAATMEALTRDEADEAEKGRRPRE